MHEIVVLLQSEKLGTAILPSFIHKVKNTYSNFKKNIKEKRVEHKHKKMENKKRTPLVEKKSQYSSFIQEDKQRKEK